MSNQQGAEYKIGGMTQNNPVHATTPDLSVDICLDFSTFALANPLFSTQFCVGGFYIAMAINHRQHCGTL